MYSAVDTAYILRWKNYHFQYEEKRANAINEPENFRA